MSTHACARTAKTWTSAYFITSVFQAACSVQHWISVGFQPDFVGHTDLITCSMLQLCRRGRVLVELAGRGGVGDGLATHMYKMSCIIHTHGRCALRLAL